MAAVAVGPLTHGPSSWPATAGRRASLAAGQVRSKGAWRGVWSLQTCPSATHGFPTACAVPMVCPLPTRAGGAPLLYFEAPNVLLPGVEVLAAHDNPQPSTAACAAACAATKDCYIFNMASKGRLRGQCCLLAALSGRSMRELGGHHCGIRHRDLAQPCLDEAVLGSGIAATMPHRVRHWHSARLPMLCCCSARQPPAAGAWRTPQVPAPCPPAAASC